MSHPYHHALSCVKKWGGEPEDYLPIHNWFDASKESHCHFTHRALRHHAEGIFEAERVFGLTITLSNGKKVPVRLIGEFKCRNVFRVGIAHGISARGGAADAGPDRMR